jgi:hypothetical protein
LFEFFFHAPFPRQVSSVSNRLLKKSPPRLVKNAQM